MEEVGRKGKASASSLRVPPATKSFRLSQPKGAPQAHSQQAEMSGAPTAKGKDDLVNNSSRKTGYPFQKKKLEIEPMYHTIHKN